MLVEQADLAPCAVSRQTFDAAADTPDANYLFSLRWQI